MQSFRPSRMFRLGNKAVLRLVRWGLPMGPRRTPMALLTVRGRTSGLARTTPVALRAHGDGWLLVAVYGVSDWSKNLEAAGEATIQQRGHTTPVRSRRMLPAEAAPVLRDAMLAAPAFVRRMTSPYFTADVDSPFDAWEEEAVAHPVFLLTPFARTLGHGETPAGTSAHM